MLQVFLTIQTARIAPDGTPRVVAIAAIETQGSSPTGREFHAYLNPGAPLLDEVELPDGLSALALLEQPSFIEIASELDALASNAKLITHSPSDSIETFQSQWREKADQSSALPLPQIQEGQQFLALVSPEGPLDLRDFCARWLVDVVPEPRRALGEARMLAAAVLRCQEVLAGCWQRPIALGPVAYSELLRSLKDAAQLPENFGVGWLQRQYKLGYNAALSVMNQLIVTRAVSLRSGQSGLTYERGSLASHHAPLNRANVSADLTHVYSAAAIAEEIIQARRDCLASECPGGITTGLEVIDDATGGLIPGHMWVIAGSDHEGRHELTTAMALEGALKHEKRVLLVSLRTRRWVVARRLAGRISNTKTSPAREPDSSAASEWEKLTAGLDVLAQHAIWIDDTPRMSMDELCSRARALAAQEGGLDVLVVDRLTCLGGELPGQPFTAPQIQRNVSSLKALALELKCTVLLEHDVYVNDRNSRAQSTTLDCEIPHVAILKRISDVFLTTYNEERWHLHPSNPKTLFVQGTISRDSPGFDIALHYDHRTGIVTDRAHGLWHLEPDLA